MNRCSNSCAAVIAVVPWNATDTEANNDSQASQAQLGSGRWLRTIGAIAALCMLPFSSCEAMYKCKQTNDSYAYQDSPCAESNQARPFSEAALKPENSKLSASPGAINQELRTNSLTPGQAVDMPSTPNPAPNTRQNFDAAEADKNVQALPSKTQPARGTEYLPVIIAFLVVYLYFRWIISIARRASRNGRSFTLWFLISTHFTPMIAGTILTMLDGNE